MSDRHSTLEAERAVLGATLVDAEAAKTALGILDSDDFSDDRHKIVFRSVERLNSRGEPCDLMVVTRELSADDRLKAAGGAPYVSGLLDDCPDVANVDFYAGLVKSDSQARKVLAEARLMVAALEAGKDADDVMASFRARTEGTRAVDSSEWLRAAWNTVPSKWVEDDAPPMEWLFDADDSGAGLVPRGKVALLVSEGGTGKSQLAIQAAVSVATGRPWAGAFPPGKSSVGGIVVVVLAEEDDGENHRRLRRTVKALSLTVDERQKVIDRVVLIPADAKDLVLIEDDGRGNPKPSAVFNTLKELVSGDERIVAVFLDPLARFGGRDSEMDNWAATQLLAQIQGLCDTPGKPAVVIAAHSSKFARRGGDVDSRGVTALTDAARLVLGLKRKSQGRVEFSILKANYSGLPEPTEMVWDNGIIRALTADDIENERIKNEDLARAQTEGNARRIVDFLKDRGPVSKRKDIYAGVSMRSTDGSAALHFALTTGWVWNQGTDRRPEYVSTYTEPVEDHQTAEAENGSAGSMTDDSGLPGVAENVAEVSRSSMCSERGSARSAHHRCSRGTESPERVGAPGAREHEDPFSDETDDSDSVRDRDGTDSDRGTDKDESPESEAGNYEYF